MANINFDDYKIDLLTLACERLIGQFNQSTTGIQPYIEALVNQTQDWNTITQSVFIGRFIDDAQGVQLDKIGRLIGLSRPSIDGIQLLYFKWDNLEGNIGWDGDGGWFSTNAPTAGSEPMTDSNYRAYLKGKIFKNQVTGATVPEIIRFAKIIWDVDISVQVTPVLIQQRFFAWDRSKWDFEKVWYSKNALLLGSEPMSLTLIVPPTISGLAVQFLLSSTSDAILENDYFVPIANGVRILGVLVLPENSESFGWDADKNATILGWDSGKWAVKVPPSI